MVDGIEVTYNSRYYSVTAIFEGIEEGDTVNFTYDDAKYSTVGEYNAKIQTWDNVNYKLPSDIDVSWKIVPKVVVLDWTGVTNSFTYNEGHNITVGTPSYTYSSDYTDVNDGKVYESLNLQYADNVKTNVGSYVVSVTGTGNRNYTLNSSSNTTFDWEITQKTISLEWEYNSTIYCKSTKYPRAYYEFYDYNKGEWVTVTAVTYDTRDCGMDVGTYTVYATGIDNANFVLPTDENSRAKQYQIQPKQLAFSWTIDGSSNFDNLIYTGLNRTVIPTATNVEEGDVVSLTYSENVFKKAGDYSVSVTGNTNGNYTYQSSTNYKAFTIGKKKVTFTWKWDGSINKTAFIYDGVYHNLNAVVVGAVNGETVTVSNYTGEQSFINNGEHTVRVNSISDSVNYYFDTYGASETIIINKQPIKIEWHGETNVTYDRNAHELVATVTGVNDGKTISFSYSSAGNSFTNAGSHTATVSALNDSNYTLTTGVIGSKSCSLTINKKVANVEWSGAREVTYDVMSHYLSASVSNKVDGDTVTLTLKYYKNGSNANSTANAGVYDVKVESINNSNYRLPVYGESGYSELSSTLTIVPQKVRITWEQSNTVTYTGSAITSYYPTVRGVDNGNSVNYILNDEQRINVGDYDVEVVSLNDSNYTLEDAIGNLVSRFTIVPKQLVVSWSNTSFTYNGSYQYPTINVYTEISSKTVSPVGFERFDDESSTWVSVDKPAVRDAGEYKFRVTAIKSDTAGVSKDNFALPTNEISIKVAKKNVQMSGKWYDGNGNWIVNASNNCSIDYDGQIHSLNAVCYNSEDTAIVGEIKYEIAKIVSGSEVSLNQTNGAKDAGTYIVRVVGFENENCVPYSNKYAYITINKVYLDSTANIKLNQQFYHVGDTVTAVYDDGVETFSMKFKIVKDGYVTLATDVTEYTFTQAGNYALTLTGVDSENYVLQSNFNMSLGGSVLD